MMNALTVYGARLVLPAVLLVLVATSLGMLSQPRGVNAAEAGVDVGDLWFCSSGFQGASCDTFIEAGDTVNWNWVGFLPHNVFECGNNWSNGPSCAGADWSSSTQTAGNFNRQFDTPGVYYYLCTVHPTTMKGTITVASAVGGIAELPSTTSVAIESPNSSSGSQGLLVALVAGGAAAVATFSVGLWYLRRKVA